MCGCSHSNLRPRRAILDFSSASFRTSGFLLASGLFGTEFPSHFDLIFIWYASSKRFQTAAILQPNIYFSHLNTWALAHRKQIALISPPPLEVIGEYTALVFGGVLVLAKNNCAKYFLRAQMLPNHKKAKPQLGPLALHHAASALVRLCRRSRCFGPCCLFCQRFQSRKPGTAGAERARTSGSLRGP